MSGGSLDYICYRVDDAATSIASKATTPEQRAFAKHLRLVSKALHDVEWVFSGDCGEGDDSESIRAVVSFAAILESEIERAEQVLVDLKNAIALVTKKGN
jgi:RNase P/RNase MRP subunit p30